jgi:hypothetical protein
MENTHQAFSMGARKLSSAEAATVNLGPLKNLQGTWVGKPADGWNVIAVPGPSNKGGFILEVIPYEEKLTFTPVVVAGNRGPVVNNAQQEQHLMGLMYEQTVTSVCNTPQCVSMGFGAGNVIHAETGLFLFLPENQFNSGFNIARLSTIPHGNSVLALGNAQDGTPTNNNFIKPVSISPKAVPGSSLPLGYDENQYPVQQFPNFNQSNPNSFLTKTLGNQKIIAMTTILLSTNNKDGGILNIPFIKQNVNATKMDSTFWIETIQNPTPGKPDIMQLQYTQTINLVFPPTGSNTPIIWPHVTVNTLTKV